MGLVTCSDVVHLARRPTRYGAEDVTSRFGQAPSAVVPVRDAAGNLEPYLRAPGDLPEPGFLWLSDSYGRKTRRKNTIGGQH